MFTIFIMYTHMRNGSYAYGRGTILALSVYSFVRPAVLNVSGQLVGLDHSVNVSRTDMQDFS